MKNCNKTTMIKGWWDSTTCNQFKNKKEIMKLFCKDVEFIRFNSKLQHCQKYIFTFLEYFHIDVLSKCALIINLNIQTQKSETIKSSLYTIKYESILISTLCSCRKVFNFHRLILKINVSTNTVFITFSTDLFIIWIVLNEFEYKHSIRF